MPLSCSRRRPRRRSRYARRSRLRFTPDAWAKLLFLRDHGPTEVGGFGISSAADPLLVEEFVLVRQHCTAVTVAFEDAAVADYFDAQVDRGLPPYRFARIWIHTHPGSSATPSSVDEETFRWSFLEPEWAVMAILARSGATYARLKFNTGPGGDVRLGVGVDYSARFGASDPVSWAAEYARQVTDECPFASEAVPEWPQGRRSPGLRPVLQAAEPGSRSPGSLPEVTYPQ